MFIEEINKYDGYMLHQRFAYKYFRDQCSALGNIIAFRGAMEVLADAMLDTEDKLNEAFIYSDDAINFLWELPQLGHNAFGAVCYQRLFNTRIAEILQQAELLNKPIIMHGDDLMVTDNNDSNTTLGKCSVSITHCIAGAALGHTGINITAGTKAPSHAYSTNLSDVQVDRFIEAVIAMFYQLNQDLFVATCKIIS